MKIRLKIFLTIFILILITGMATTMVSQAFSEDIIAEEVRTHLEDVAHARAEHVETFIDAEKKSALQLSQSIVIERLLIANRSDADYEAKFSDVTTRLKNSAGINEEIYDISLIDMNGTIIASSIEERNGLDCSDDPYFINSKKGVYVKSPYYSQIFKSQPSIAVSAPVFSDAAGDLIYSLHDPP